jgi:hypothetical protein
MAESKFSGIFQNSAVEEPKAPAGRTEKHAAPVLPAKALGRPPGKRSNPDYAPVQVLLKKQTHKLTRRILSDLDNGQDVSELVQTLLEQWVAKHQKKNDMTA